MHTENNKKDETKNPFAAADGGPIDGREDEFWNWEVAKYEAYLATLSPEERSKQIAADKHLSKKMNS